MRDDADLPREPSQGSLDPELLARYVTGAASIQDARIVTAWLAAAPEHAVELERWRTLLKLPVGQGTTLPPVTFDPAVGANRVWAAIAHSELQSARRTPASHRTLRRSIPYAVGALAAGTVIVVTAHWWAASGPWRIVAAQQYATHPSQRETITLPNGTRLTLAPASTLRVPVDYARGNRTVSLDGEAFFAVAHNAAHPFSVRTPRATVEDIGTQFDVREYGDDRTVRVAVIEGRVGLRTGRGGILAARGRAAPDQSLDRGDVAVIDTAIAVTHNADVASATAWTQGRLVFDNVPVRDVAAMLGRWYDVEIVADTAVGRLPFSASFDNQPLDQVLAAMSAALRASVERHGRTITLVRPAGRDP